MTCRALTLLGIVPINAATLAWEPAAPPKNWRALVNRWVRFDTARCWAAMTAFACFLTTISLQ